MEHNAKICELSQCKWATEQDRTEEQKNEWRSKKGGADRRYDGSQVFSLLCYAKVLKTQMLCIKHYKYCTEVPEGHTFLVRLLCNLSRPQTWPKLAL